MPKIDSKPRIGLKRKKKRKAWSSIDDILGEVEMPVKAGVAADDNSPWPQGVLEPSLTGLGEPPARSIKDSENEDTNGEKKVNSVAEPSLNQVKKYSVEVHELRKSSEIDNKKSNSKTPEMVVRSTEKSNPVAEPGSKKTSLTKRPNHVSEPSLNQVQRLQRETNEQPSRNTPNSVAKLSLNRVSEPSLNQVNKAKSSGSLSQPSLNQVPYPVQPPSLNQVQKLEIEESPKLGAELVTANLESLRGNNHALFSHIATYMIEKNKSQITTTYLTLNKILGIPLESLKTSFKRLQKLNLLSNKSTSKGGRGSKRIIEIDRGVLNCFTSCLLNSRSDEFLQANPVQTQNLTRFEPSPIPGSDGSSKLVSNLNSTNLTKKEEMEIFYEEVDFSPLEENGFLKENGLYRAKIIGEISKNRWNITPSDLGEIIEKFVVYSSEKNNIYNIKSLKGFFFKQCKRVHEGELLDIDEAETAEDRAGKALKEKMLTKKAEQESLKTEIINIGFDLWWEASSPESRKQLCPEAYKMAVPEDVERRAVKGKWEQVVWPRTPEFKDFEKAFGLGKYEEIKF